MKCATCGKELLSDDYLKKWRKCELCNATICFNCTHYLGTHVRGLYYSYTSVLAVCVECYPEKTLR